MFKIFKNKTRYDRGQLFPYLIAILVAVLTIAMITVNLGQLGVFKTDVSNAADAGALAGASTLSAYLLGIGLQSDNMCGVMLMEVVGIVIALCVPAFGLPVAFAIWLALVIKQYAAYFKALQDGKMAWSNAKKAALQYAFQNAGIDEPRPTFKQFLRNVYGVSDPDNLSLERLAYYNKVYALGDDPDEPDSRREAIKRHSQSGFSRFMEGSWYWDEDAWGKIRPGNMAPGIVTNGYGWNASGENSFDSENSDWASFENSVKVTVSGYVMYPLQVYNPADELKETIVNWLDEHIDPPWWLEWIGDVVGWIISLALDIIGVLLPGGLMMENLKQHTDDNPITVTVQRRKQSNNLGLWRFRYGIVQSQSSAHVYGEDDGDSIPHDIIPMFFKDIGDITSGKVLANQFSNMLSSGEEEVNWKLFNTNKHLFEAEIISVR